MWMWLIMIMFLHLNTKQTLLVILRQTEQKKRNTNSCITKIFEMPLINCKVGLSLGWIKECVLTTAEIGADANTTGANSATFKITDAKLYVPVFTLSTEDSVKLSEQLDEGFKRPVYWNKYKVIDNSAVEIAAANTNKYIRDYLSLLMITKKVIIKFLLIFS